MLAKMASVPARNTVHPSPLPESPGTQIKIRRPDDWHLHLRDGADMQSVLPHTAERFARAIVMPNLKPPVTTAVAGLGPIVAERVFPGRSIPERRAPGTVGALGGRIGAEGAGRYAVRSCAISSKTSTYRSTDSSVWVTERVHSSSRPGVM